MKEEKNVSKGVGVGILREACLGQLSNHLKASVLKVKVQGNNQLM